MKSEKIKKQIEKEIEYHEKKSKEYDYDMGYADGLALALEMLNMTDKEFDRNFPKIKMPNCYKGKRYTLPEEKIKIGRPLDATFRTTEDSAGNYAAHLFKAFDQAIKRMENGEDVEPECIKKARIEVEEYWNSQVKDKET